jgi:hypothetical protein
VENWNEKQNENKTIFWLSKQNLTHLPVLSEDLNLEPVV